MVVQPGNAEDGVVFGTQPTVRMQDVNSANVHLSSQTVTVAKATGSGTLTGTTSVATNSQGIAVFTNLKITGTGAHTLVFTQVGLGLTAVNSGGFTVTNLLLSADGTVLRLPDNSAFAFRGAIAVTGTYDWPLFKEAWVDLVAPYDVTVLHLRLGPFLTTAGGESGLAAYGGGYVETGGKSDLTQFNATFWNRIATLIGYARTNGMWVEVDVADGWAIKQTRGAASYPGYCSWKAANNVQNADHSNAGSAAVTADAVHEAWVRKVVQVTGVYDNVIYQDGNEISTVNEYGGNAYSPTWSTSMQTIIRDEELLQGYSQHLFGTNSENTTTEQHSSVQYIEHHNTGVAIATLYGKPTLVGEYNPTPVLTPSQIATEVCDAKALGSYFWYWMQEGEESNIAATLTAIAAGCGVAATKLVMVTQPAGARDSTAFDTQPAVRLQDVGSANVAVGGVSVTVAKASGSGTLGDTLTAATNSSGIATFAGLSIAGSGSHTLSFNSANLTGVTSASFTVNAATKLAMVIQPGGATAGVVMGAQPQVHLQDTNSANVTKSGVVVTASKSSGPGTLSGTANATTGGSGVAGWSNLALSATGDYVLAFASSGLTGVNSASFTVVAPSAIWPNDPGTTTIVETDWSSGTLGTWNSGDMLGWRPAFYDGTRSNAIVSAAGPNGETRLLRYTYPASHAGGGGVEVFVANLYSHARIYMAIHWRVSSNWYGHPSSIFKLFNIWDDSEQGGCMWYESNSIGDNATTLTRIINQLIGTSPYTGGATGGSQARGSWHLMETTCDFTAKNTKVYLDGSSTPTINFSWTGATSPQRTRRSTWTGPAPQQSTSVGRAGKACPTESACLA